MLLPDDRMYRAEAQHRLDVKRDVTRSKYAVRLPRGIQHHERNKS
jgi:hypothetical protein